MKRLKSIDIFRGCSMAWMMIGHLFHWAIKEEYLWARYLLGSIFDPMGASAFLFIAGVSTMLSYRNRLQRAENSENYNKKMVKYEYFLRATFILIIALIYNTFVAIRINDLTWIWTWFILFTIAFSLYFAWPLLIAPKLLRIIVSGVIWISNQIFLSLFHLRFLRGL